ncbi:hypothetical protein ACRAWF_05020 [Streptomyces sp. L7]
MAPEHAAQGGRRRPSTSGPIRSYAAQLPPSYDLLPDPRAAALPHNAPARTTAHPAATAPHANSPFHGRGTAPTPSSHVQATATATHPTSPHSRTVHTSTARTNPTPQLPRGVSGRLSTMHSGRTVPRDGERATES